MRRNTGQQEMVDVGNGACSINREIGNLADPMPGKTQYV